MPDRIGGAPLFGWSQRRAIVVDESMRPTLRPGDRLVVEPTAYRHRVPTVGDVVVLDDPDDPSRRLVKRVAAIGPAPSPRPADQPDPIPPGHLFVLSDADVPARDSRTFGAVPVSALRGRAVRIYFPPDRRTDL